MKFEKFLTEIKFGTFLEDGPPWEKHRWLKFYSNMLGIRPRIWTWIFEPINNPWRTKDVHPIKNQRNRATPVELRKRIEFGASFF